MACPLPLPHTREVGPGDGSFLPSTLSLPIAWKILDPPPRLLNRRSDKRHVMYVRSSDWTRLEDHYSAESSTKTPYSRSWVFADS